MIIGTFRHIIITICLSYSAQLSQNSGVGGAKGHIHHSMFAKFLQWSWYWHGGHMEMTILWERERERGRERRREKEMRSIGIWIMMRKWRKEREKKSIGVCSKERRWINTLLSIFLICMMNVSRLLRPNLLSWLLHTSMVHTTSWSHDSHMILTCHRQRDGQCQWASWFHPDHTWHLRWPRPSWSLDCTPSPPLGGSLEFWEMFCEMEDEI